MAWAAMISVGELLILGDLATFLVIFSPHMEENLTRSAGFYFNALELA